MLTRAVGTHDSAIMGENPKVDMNEVEVEIEVKLNKVEHDKVEELEQPKWTRVFDGKSMIKIEESETLGKISSGLGKPMHSDECTRTQSRISYARVLVDMNVTQVMPDKISIADPTNRVFE
ncbi:hypothetical protein FXO38_33159 [Capsicum annuum]|nr:hypothetical protein FXO38_33159 [Capsicum annuum]